MWMKGSICLDDIPEEYITKFISPDGEEKRYINFHIYSQKSRKVKKRNGKIVFYTHELVLMPANYGEAEKLKISEISEMNVNVATIATTPKKKTRSKKQSKQQQEPVNVFDYSAVDEDLF